MARYTGPKSRIARNSENRFLVPINIWRGKTTLPDSMG